MQRWRLAVLVVLVSLVLISALGLALAPYVIIQNYSFTPKEFSIKAGTTVTWVNIDLYVHTVRAGTQTRSVMTSIPEIWESWASTGTPSQSLESISTIVNLIRTCWAR